MLPGRREGGRREGLSVCEIVSSVRTTVHDAIFSAQAALEIEGIIAMSEFLQFLGIRAES